MPSRWTLFAAAFLSALAAQGATAVGGGVATAPVVRATLAAEKPKRTDLATSKELWATVNVCDTPKQANTIGVRASMPGLGNRRSRMAIRIRVQYRSKTNGRWKRAGKSLDSGWKRIGSTIRQVIESGQSFRLKPPTDGGWHLLRGEVSYRWKRNGRVVARQRRITTGGHKTPVADPKGYSAAECEISAP